MSPSICSVADLEIEVSLEIRDFLRDQYAKGNGDDVIPLLFSAMKQPPPDTICRVNNILSSRDEVEAALHEVLDSYPHLKLDRHGIFSDVVCISPRTASSDMQYSSRTPQPTATKVEFENSELRQSQGWPMTYRVVLCDRFCGEAVLRGSDIFVRGILAADSAISYGETVAVYADISAPTDHSTRRASQLDEYLGRCVFLGLGVTACSRTDFFRASQGLGVVMSKEPQHRVGPCHPPLSGVLDGKMMLQNLPSILVGHALNPQRGDNILDMCAAPGGKTAHLASLVCNEATIISCDKSRKKVVAVKELFARIGATCVTPLALDATKCVDPNMSISIEDLLASVDVDEKDNLLRIKSFPPEAFDRIMLDPPCSALGLRPKLFVAQASLHELRKHADYQRKFVSQAIALLKPGGVLTYSTCTINAEENEAMVHYILKNFPAMILLPIAVEMGQPGLPGFGLNDKERGMVRRFDPFNAKDDTMGFFVALLQKTQS